MRIFSNKEFRRACIFIALFNFIFASVVLIFWNREKYIFTKELVEINSSIVDKVSLKDKALAEELCEMIINGTKEKSNEEGKTILRKYGYDESMTLEKYYSYSIYGNGTKLIIFIVVIMTLATIVILVIHFKKLYKDINVISQKAKKAMTGVFESCDYEEVQGEVAYLYYSFNQMIGRLKKSVELLKEEQSFLQITLQDISHQLKTPLASIMIFNDLLIDNPNMKINEREDFLIKTKSQLLRMKWLIVNLLKLAKLEAGTVEFNLKHTSIRKTIDKALEPMIYIALEKNVSIKVEGDDININHDSLWISEAIGNIVKNSIEHTENGGRLTIFIVSIGAFSKVIIQDNGEGIDKEHLPHVFERFYKGSNDKSMQSVGIGLSLAKAIIKGNNGDIDVISKKGEGTTFTITFSPIK